MLPGKPSTTYLPTDIRESRDAFGLRLKILAATDRWEQCQHLAIRLVATDPSWPLLRILGAEAIGTTKARRLTLYSLSQ